MNNNLIHTALLSYLLSAFLYSQALSGAPENEQLACCNDGSMPSPQPTDVSRCTDGHNGNASAGAPAVTAVKYFAGSSSLQ